MEKEKHMSNVRDVLGADSDSDDQTRSDSRLAQRRKALLQRKRSSSTSSADFSTDDENVLPKMPPLEMHPTKLPKSKGPPAAPTGLLSTAERAAKAPDAPAAKQMPASLTLTSLSPSPAKQARDIAAKEEAEEAAKKVTEIKKRTEEETSAAVAARKVSAAKAPEAPAAKQMPAALSTQQAKADVNKGSAQPMSPEKELEVLRKKAQYAQVMWKKEKESLQAQLMGATLSAQRDRDFFSLTRASLEKELAEAKIAHEAANQAFAKEKESLMRDLAEAKVAQTNRSKASVSRERPSLDYVYHAGAFPVLSSLKNMEKLPLADDLVQAQTAQAISENNNNGEALRKEVQPSSLVYRGTPRSRPQTPPLRSYTSNHDSAEEVAAAVVPQLVDSEVPKEDLTLALEVMSLQQSLDAKKKESEANREALLVLQKENQVLQIKVCTLRNERYAGHEALQLKVNDLEASLVTVQREKEALLKSAQSDYEKLSSGLETLREEVKIAKEDNVALRAELEDARKQLSLLQKEYTAVLEKTRLANENVVALEKQLRDEKQSVAFMRAENDKYKQQMQESKAAVEHLEQSLSEQRSMKESNESLTAQVAKLESLLSPTPRASSSGRFAVEQEALNIRHKRLTLHSSRIGAMLAELQGVTAYRAGVSLSPSPNSTTPSPPR